MLYATLYYTVYREALNRSIAAADDDYDDDGKLDRNVT